MKNTAFLRGVVEALTSQLGLEQMSLQDYSEARKQWDQLNSTASTVATTTTLDTGSRIPTFKPSNRGFLLQHPEEWNSIVQRHLSQTQEQPRQQPATQMPTNTHRHSCNEPPRIQILSRQKTRGISNAKELADRLSKLKYRGQNNRNTTTTDESSPSTTPVTVHFF